jgi:aminoglycoside phosphotransferase
VILAPDPAVPQRDALLDERYMASRLGAGRCERINAKYRVGDSLRVVYRADADRILAGRTFRGRSRSVFRRAVAVSEPGAVLHLEELESVFWTFPNDRRLAGLRVLDRRNGALEALVGAPVASTRLMAYAPERAATAECRDADDRVLAYVKVHWDAAERELANAAAAAAAVGTANEHLRIARVLAHSLPDQALVYEPLGGDRLDGIDDLAPALRALGAALATLHGIRPLPERRFDRLAPERLALAAEVVGQARPDCAAAADELHERLADGPPDSEPVHLHGDANLRNALLDGGRIGLVDLEDAAAGPAAADLGFVIAGLMARGDCGEWALLDGYSRVAPAPSAESLRWHVAATVLARIAVPAVGRVRPVLLGRLESLLRAAGERLG